MSFNLSSFDLYIEYHKHTVPVFESAQNNGRKKVVLTGELMDNQSLPSECDTYGENDKILQADSEQGIPQKGDQNNEETDNTKALSFGGYFLMVLVNELSNILFKFSFDDNGESIGYVIKVRLYYILNDLLLSFHI